MRELSHLKNKLLAEQIQEQLYQYIQNTPLEVGTKLPNEAELGHMFHVGRSTIREAVKLLVSRGILQVRQGSGTYVISRTPIDLDPLHLQHIGNTMSVALDLAEVRMILEPGIAELAAIHATDAEIQKLETLCKQIEEKISQGKSYIDEDIAFHSCIAECSHNKVVEQLIPLIDTTVLMFVNVTHTQLTQETIMTHRSIVEAITQKDPIGAKAAMMTHMNFNRTYIKHLIQASEEEII